MEKIKKAKKLCGDVHGYVAQLISQIDAEIFQNFMMNFVEIL